MALFPNTRLRRTRSQPWIRDLVRETRLTPQDLIWTLVVSDSADPIEPVEAMPGTVRMNVAEAANAARRAKALGIPAIAVFPHIDPSLKDGSGKEALNPDGLVMRAVKAMKDAAPEVGVICDVALDPFTDHGHDGVMENGVILNDATIDLLIQQSLAQVEAGCDVLAPSDMMDGRIGAIRAALEEAGHTDTLILSYAAKYASGFYGPYRSAIGSAALKGDKKTYQMDPANWSEALREVEMDIEEGADMVMVKPGMPYLDIIRRVKDAFGVPTFAYQVSGEYAMLKCAAGKGWLDGDRAILESLIGFKRAGANGILTYAAVEVAKTLKGK